MNRNNKENIRVNAVLVLGEIERMKLDHSNQLPTINLLENNQQKNGTFNSPFTPTKIYSQNNSIAVIDQNDQAWLVSQPFETPVNLSNLIKNKIYHLFLGQKELIAKTKKGSILINWGSKKLIQKQALTKLNTFTTSDYCHLFEVFAISFSQPTDFYFYTLEKKVENINRLYYMKQSQKQLIGYPSGNIVTINSNIKGISVGKYYSLCWDQNGKLFSWGTKSLGLGYGSLPEEELIQTPREVLLQKKIMTAFADCHYSLALSEQGIIYEWGIKRDINEINQQLIFRPRPLQFRYFHCKAKFVSLKGKEGNYAALSSIGQLYVWGINARGLLNPKIQLPTNWKSNYIFQPVLQTDLLHYYIHDFSIQNRYLVIAAGSHESIPGNGQYWNILKQKAKKQVQQFKMIRISTESMEVAKLKKKYKNSIIGYHDHKSQRLNFSETKNKQKLGQIKNKLTHQILNRNKSQKEEFPFNNYFKKTAPTLSNPIWPFNTIKLHKRQVSDTNTPQLFSQMKFNQKLRHSQLGSESEKINYSIKKNQNFSQIYSKRLQEILYKKKQIELQTINANLKKIDERTIQYKQRKKQEQQLQKNKKKQIQILQQTFVNFLIKEYALNLVRETIKFGRQYKLNNQSTYSFTDKLQNNLKKTSIANKVKLTLQNLKTQYFYRYFFLQLYFEKHVKNFRKRRFLKFRRTTVSEILKINIKEKLQSKIKQLKLKMQKICKLNIWFVFFKKQQRKCLKQLWNTYVASTFKLKDGGQFYFSLSNPNINFKQYFHQKIQKNSFLKLDKFIKFKRCFQENQQSFQRKPINGEFKRKAQRIITEKINLNEEILPNSLHYNFFRKPKHLDIIIDQAVRVSPLWPQIQKKSLEQFLKSLLRQNYKQYVLKLREYDKELANFIKSRYEIFYQKRWKYIIQYNKIEKTLEKQKKQAKLRRLMKLIGMSKLIDQDIIPQKHIVLQEAINRKDSPPAPDPILHFDLKIFQQIYKVFVQSLQNKAKSFRKKLQ